MSVCLAITRLRVGVVTCCWIVGLALAAQALVWGVAVFTEVRFDAEAEEVVADAPLVVHAEAPQTSGRILPNVNGRRADVNAAPDAAPEVEAATSQRSLSSFDAMMGTITDLAGGGGRLAMLALLAIMALGVTLSASAAITGVEKSCSAFMWSLLVAILVLPIGGAMGLPWEGGALTTYEHIAGEVDRAASRAASNASNDEAAAAAHSPLLFYARFLLLPAACIVGIAMVGLRFCLGVEAAVLQRESMKLDPAIEKEAANIKPSSLHGSARGATVLSRTVMTSATTSEPPPTSERNSTPTAHRRTAPVVASTVEEQVEDAPPKRLI